MEIIITKLSTRKNIIKIMKTMIIKMTMVPIKIKEDMIKDNMMIMEMVTTTTIIVIITIININSNMETITTPMLHKVEIIIK